MQYYYSKLFPQTLLVQFLQLKTVSLGPRHEVQEYVDGFQSKTNLERLRNWMQYILAWLLGKQTIYLLSFGTSYI